METEKKLSVKQKSIKPSKSLKNENNTKKKKAKPNKSIDTIQLEETDSENEDYIKIQDTQPKKSKKPLISKVVKPPDSVPKLYIRFKKTMQSLAKTQQDLIAMHPSIKSVRLSRKKLNSKYFFAIFDSEEKALKALKALSERKDCFVKVAFKASGKESTSQIAPKSNLRSFWQ